MANVCTVQGELLYCAGQVVFPGCDVQVETRVMLDALRAWHFHVRAIRGAESLLLRILMQTVGWAFGQWRAVADYSRHQSQLVRAMATYLEDHPALDALSDMALRRWRTGCALASAFDAWTLAVRTAVSSFFCYLVQHEVLNYCFMVPDGDI